MVLFLLYTLVIRRCRSLYCPSNPALLVTRSYSISFTLILQTVIRHSFHSFYAYLMGRFHIVQVVQKLLYPKCTQRGYSQPYSQQAKLGIKSTQSLLYNPLPILLGPFSSLDKFLFTAKNHR